ncbi:MAG: DUF2341 domain-containing protein [archaeon]|nr:DUF2341 domain-containing protein [archaeon]
MHTKRTKILQLAILGLMFLVIAQSVVAVPANWWNNSYNYRSDIIIGPNHLTITTNHTYSMTINTFDLIFLGKMQTDCDDLRIYDTIGQVELDREIKDCGLPYTTIFWKAQYILPFDVGDENTYDLYYGNPTAGNDHSNLKNVYRFYDDFSDGIINPVWIVDEAEEINGTMQITSNSDNDLSGAVAPSLTIPFNTIFETKIKTITNYETGNFGLGTNSNPTNPPSISNSAWLQYIGYSNPSLMDAYANGQYLPSLDTYVGNIYKLFKVEYTANNTKFYSDDGGGYILRATSSSSSSENLMNPVFDVRCQNECTGGPEIMVIDWIKLYQFISPVPTIFLGPEETGDSDGDGVFDTDDQCPSTPSGEPVDTAGCSCSQKVCDDNNLCTDDSCNESNAQCEFANDNSNSCGSARDCADDSCYLNNYPPHYLYQTYPIDGTDYCDAGSCVQYSCDAITSNFEATCNPDYNQLTALQQQVSDLQSQANQTQQKTNLLDDLLRFLPTRFQTTMMCGYMNFSQQTTFSHWGLTCDIVNSTCSCYGIGGELVQ